MTISWVVYALIVGSFVALGAHVADELQRRRGGRQRWIWLVALSLTCGLVAVAMLSPRSVPVSAAPSAPGRASVPTGALIAALQHAQIGAIESSRSLMGPRADFWTRLLVCGLAGVAAVLALTTYSKFARLARRLPRAEMLGISIRIAPHTGPAVVGVYRPQIVVPSWFLQRSADEQRIVLSHESEHIRAADPLVLAAATIAIVLLPWHPAIWWMASRLRLAVEMDCDRRVLARGVTPTRYGRMLLDFAERSSGMSYGLAGITDRRSHLEWRIRTMIIPRSGTSRVRLIGSGCAVALMLIAACSVEVPTELSKVNAASAEQVGDAAGLLSPQILGAAPAGTRYLVDGKEVSAVEAERVLPENIQSISVSRGKDQSGEISIVTKSADANSSENGSQNGGHRKSGAGVVAGVMFGFHEGQSKPESPNDYRILRFMKTGTADADEPLVYIDGVVTGRDSVARIDPHLIESISMLKDGAAAGVSGGDPRAAHGVLMIVTKHNRQ